MHLIVVVKTPGNFYVNLFSVLPPSSVPPSIVNLKTVVRSSSSAAYWLVERTSFSRAVRCAKIRGEKRKKGKEGRQTTRVFAYRDESARCDVRFAWVGRYIRALA